MRITVKAEVNTSGLDALRSAVSGGMLARVVRKAAFDLLADAIRRVTDTTKSGRLYRRGKRWHRASAEGEAPASDTGALVASGFVRRVSDLVSAVGFNQKYARILELHRKRPFLLPAMDEVGPQLTKAVSVAITQAVERASRGGRRG